MWIIDSESQTFLNRYFEDTFPGDCSLRLWLAPHDFRFLRNHVNSHICFLSYLYIHISLFFLGFSRKHPSPASLTTTTHGANDPLVMWKKCTECSDHIPCEETNGTDKSMSLKRYVPSLSEESNRSSAISVYRWRPPNSWNDHYVDVSSFAIAFTIFVPLLDDPCLIEIHLGTISWLRHSI